MNNNQLQQQPQQLTPQQQFEKENILRRRMTTTKLNFLDHITAEQFDTVKKLVHQQFGEKSASKFKVANEHFLEIYTRLFEEGATEFMLTEWGVISDMLYVELPYSMCTEVFQSIKEYLQFKIDMEILFITYGTNRTMCEQATQKEFGSKLNLVKPNIKL
jgi:hypothetical protein